MDIKKACLCFVVASVLYSCDLLQLKKQSEEIEKQYEVNTFNKVIINCPLKVVLVNNLQDVLKFEGQEHIIEGLNYSVNDSVLTLSHDKVNFIKKKNRPTVYICVTKLNKVVVNNICMLCTQERVSFDKLLLLINGKGTLSESDIDVKCQSLALSLYGEDQVGDHYLKGSCNSFKLIMEGATMVKAPELIANHITVLHKSNLDVVLNALETLNVSIYSSGDTYFYGTPKLKTEYINSIALKAKGTVHQIE